MVIFAIHIETKSIAMKVLIIDDERSIRNTLKEILEFEGHEVATAEDGKQGLDKALAENFDAIFCDIKMPVMETPWWRPAAKPRS